MRGCSWNVDPVRVLTRRELAAVLEGLARKAKGSANARLNRTILRLAYCCGLRVSEIAGLALGDVLIGSARPDLHVRPETAKGGRRRRVPLWWDQGTLDDLAAWKRERQAHGANDGDHFVCCLRPRRFASNDRRIGAIVLRCYPSVAPPRRSRRKELGELRQRIYRMLVFFIALGVASQPHPGASPPSYAITDLSSAPFAGLAKEHDDHVFPSIAYALNGRGDAVGEAFIPGGGGYGFFFRADKAVAIGCPPPFVIPTVQGRGVNGKGQVVGYFANADRHTAFLWEHGTLRDLGDLRTDGKRGFSIAHAINENGWIVGEASAGDDGRPVAFLWQDGRMNSLGVLPGGSSGGSAAHGINAKGEVVGRSAAAQGSSHRMLAFRWTKGEGMQALATLGGLNANANAINDLGQAVGEADTHTPAGFGWPEQFGRPHAALWEKDGVKDLGTLGGLASEALGVNNRGQVVGWSAPQTSASQRGVAVERAFLWTGGKMYDLNDLILKGSGWTLQKARGINDRGQIVGEGTRRQGPWRAFLLTPIVDDHP